MFWDPDIADLAVDHGHLPVVAEIGPHRPPPQEAERQNDVNLDTGAGERIPDLGKPAGGTGSHRSEPGTAPPLLRLRKGAGHAAARLVVGEDIGEQVNVGSGVDVRNQGVDSFLVACDELDVVSGDIGEPAEISIRVAAWARFGGRSGRCLVVTVEIRAAAPERTAPTWENFCAARPGSWDGRSDSR